jgi:hypothetical protein
MITRFYPVHRSLNFFDYASRLVTKHHRPHRHAALTAYHMIIGATQANAKISVSAGASSLMGSIDTGAPVSRKRAAKVSMSYAREQTGAADCVLIQINAFIVSSPQIAGIGGLLPWLTLPTSFTSTSERSTA